MELDFTSINEDFNNYEEIYSYLIEKAFKVLNLSFDPVVSVSFIDNEEIHKINKEYRKIDRPTDVISFAFLDNEDRAKEYASGMPVILGDIYISLDKADEQAKEYGHSMKRELCFLFVHGLLHLLGYDHMTKEDEEIMFPLQDKILEGETF
ncbi:MAG: rRNA maturation RNase YbeY [Bacilli bacterium]|nr:rRNA maturation RNase YbeY [Bacilli bacterium]